MQKLILLASIFMIALLQFACNKNDEFNYPLIQTGEVTDIDSTGVTFHAKILNLGNLKITDYGFVWGYGKNLTIDSSNVKCGTISNTGTVSIRVTNDLVSDKRYFVRAFIQNEDLVTYGTAVLFQSLGSSLLSVTDFSPVSGEEGTRVVIHGDNFSGSPEKNTVTFGKEIVRVDSASKSKLVVTVPEKFYTSGYVKIDVSVIGKTVSSEDEFRLAGVCIEDFYPKKLYAGDTLTLECSDFDTELSGNMVIVDAKALKLIDLSGNKIRTLIDYDIRPGKKNLILYSNGKVCRVLDSLEILSRNDFNRNCKLNGK